MIKVEMKGATEISGSKVTIQTEVTMLMHTLIDCKVLTKEEIEECLKLATMPVDELHAEVEEAKKKFFDKLNDPLLLAKILGLME